MIEITLQGRTRRLRFTARAMRLLEVQAERHLGWFLGELSAQRCGFGVAAWLLWAGLQHEAPRPPSMDDIDQALDAHVAAGGRPFDFYEPIAMALREFVPKARPQGEAKPEAGSPSTPSGSVTG